MHTIVPRVPPEILRDLVVSSVKCDFEQMFKQACIDGDLALAKDMQLSYGLDTETVEHVLTKSRKLKKHHKKRGIAQIASRGHTHVLEWLLDDGLLRPATVRRCRPVLVTEAASHGRLRVLEVLRARLGFGRDDFRCKGNIPIREACKHGHVSTVRWLLTEGSLGARDVFSDSMLAVKHVFRRGAFRTLRLFLRLGYIDLKFLDTEFRTTLRLALVHKRKVFLVLFAEEVLLEHASRVSVNLRARLAAHLRLHAWSRTCPLMTRLAETLERAHAFANSASPAATRGYCVYSAMDSPCANLRIVG